MVDSTGSVSEGPTESGVWPIFQWRYWRLVFFFGRSLLHLWFLDYVLPRLLKVKFPRRTASTRHRKMARQFRQLAVRLGGVLIKLGQFLSARVDLMPQPVIEELSGLQDKVEEVEYHQIAEKIKRNLGQNPEDLFHKFEREPVASASLGQVHLTGEIIQGSDKQDPDPRASAVKVQRPNIQNIIETDLAAIRWMVGWLKYIGFINRRADLDALYGEFSEILRDELNYEKEAKNAEIFADFSRDKTGLEVPRPNWNLTTKEVLVLEQVRGIKITEYRQLEKAGISRTEVARRVQKVYLEQIYILGFFHADPHPGNIFVRPDPEGPRVDEGKRFVLVFVDFGMVGQISPRTRSLLKQLLIAVVSKDYRHMVKLAKELHFLLPDANDEKVIEALRTLFDRYYGVTLGELASVDLDELEDLISEFRELLLEFPFQIPQDFILLGRCIGILNGITTGLDPNFQPVAQIERFARDLVVKESTLPVNSPTDQSIQWANLFSKLKEGARQFLRQFEPPIDVDVQEDEELLEKLDEVKNAIHRFTETVLAVSIMGTGALFYPAKFYVALILWTVGGLLLIGSWIYRLK